MPHEIELKLRITANHIPLLRKHPAIKQYLLGKPVTRKLVSIYYDTPQLRLHNSAIGLRIRRMSGRWSQSIKSSGTTHQGLHCRMEWEDLLHSGKPDFDKITDPYLQGIFSDMALRSALQPIFTTDVRRTEWRLQTSAGEIELALDVGHLLVHDRIVADISEVELELKSGDVAQLFDFADRLQQDIPLVLEDTSKAELGYAFYTKTKISSE